jgi:hypothetical protein
MEPKIQKFIMQLSDQKREIALQVRDAILLSSPAIKETIKWNNLTFVYNKSNLAFIYNYPKADYLSLGFFEATSLSDPFQLFEGTGKGMRHIKIRKSEDIPVEQIGLWINEAIAISVG